MASKKTLDLDNLEALGAKRLAEILLELGAGDAGIKLARPPARSGRSALICRGGCARTGLAGTAAGGGPLRMRMGPAEFHRRRRAAISRDHPEVKGLYGHRPRTVLVTLALVLAQLGLAAAVAVLPWWCAVLLAVLIGAFLAHWLNVVIHECAHNLVLRATPPNKAVAIAANLPLVVPSAIAFRHYHLLHHRFLGEPGRDSDVAPPWEARLVGRSAWRKLLWLLALPITYTVVHPLRVRPRLPLDRWFAANLAAVLLADATIVIALGWTPLLYLALSTYLSVGPHPTGAHILQEHIIFDGRYETASYYGPLNLVSSNHGLHVEHHDFPNIAGPNMTRLHRLASGHYRDLFAHRSRLRCLWRFIADPAIGLDSRITTDEGITATPSPG